MSFAGQITRKVGLIAAVSPDRVIGRNGQIPWYYPADLRRFKQLTIGSTVIMGRRTFESIGKALPERRNIIVSSSTKYSDISCHCSLPGAINSCSGLVWIIGGQMMYEEGLHLADFIDLTYVPDVVPKEGAVFFPEFSHENWLPEPKIKNPDTPALIHQRFVHRRHINI